MVEAEVVALKSDIGKNTVKFMSKICQLDCLNVPVLKSYYGTRIRVVTRHEHLLSQQNLKSITTICHKCFLESKDSLLKYRIVPKKKLSKFGKKLRIKRLKGRTLTKYQKKYWKRLKHHPGNHLEIFCKICKNKKLIKLASSPSFTKHLPPTTPSTTPSKKKIKKKKDTFCGLNQKAVLSVSPNIVKGVNEGKSKLIVKRKPKKIAVSPRELAKKKKTFDKMSELFNNSANASSTSSTGLQDFLQSL